MKTIILKSTSPEVLNEEIQEEIGKQEWKDLIIEFQYQTCKGVRGLVEHSVLVVGR